MFKNSIAPNTFSSGIIVVAIAVRTLHKILPYAVIIVSKPCMTTSYRWGCTAARTVWLVCGLNQSPFSHRQHSNNYLEHTASPDYALFDAIIVSKLCTATMEQ